MLQKVQARRTSLWRRKITLLFLPIVIFFWTFGWTLTQFGTQGRHIELKKIVQSHSEDSEIAYKPEIILLSKKAGK